MGRDSVRLRSHIRAMLLPRRWEGVGGEMSRVTVWLEEFRQRNQSDLCAFRDLSQSSVSVLISHELELFTPWVSETTMK